MEYTKEDFEELVKEEYGESNLTKQDFEENLLAISVVVLALFVVSFTVYAVIIL